MRRSKEGHVQYGGHGIAEWYEGRQGLVEDEKKNTPGNSAAAHHDPCGYREGLLKAKLFRLVVGHPDALESLADRLDEALESYTVHGSLRDRRLSGAGVRTDISNIKLPGLRPSVSRQTSGASL